MSASSAGGMAARRTSLAAKRWSCRKGIVAGCGEDQEAVISLRHRASYAALVQESRLQQPRWGEARTLCSCNSIMRNQEMRSRRVRASSGTTARSNATQDFALPAKGLPKTAGLLPMNRERGRLARSGVCSVLCMFGFVRVLASPRKIHIFGQAKPSVIEVRRPQDSSGSTSGSRGTGHRARAASHAVLAAKWSSDLQP